MIDEWAFCMDKSYQLVVGPRGCGKTTFLMDTRSEVSLRLPGTIWFVDECSVYDWHGDVPGLRKLLSILSRASRIAQVHYPNWAFKVFMRSEMYHQIRKQYGFLRACFLSGFPIKRISCDPTDLIQS